MKKNITIGFKPTILALALMASFSAMAQTVPPTTTEQIVTNEGTVLNTSSTPKVIGATGDSSSVVPINLSTGSTVSVTATGAAASYSVTAVNAPVPVTTLGDGIQQSARNIGPSVGNYGGTSDEPVPLTIVLGTGSSGALGGNIGIGASVSIAATGAVAAVSVSGISDNSFESVNFTLPTIGNVSQFLVDGFTYSAGVLNNANVTNNGSITSIGNMLPGASASISATGAVGSVGVSIVAADALTTPASVPPITTIAASIGQIGQWVSNTGSVTNTGLITMASPITGEPGSSAAVIPLLDTASSVSISASGAVAAVNISLVNSSLTAPALGWIVGPVVQYVNNTADSITNTGSFTSLTPADLGRGASVSIAATGAAASFSVSAVSGDATQSAVTLPTLIGGDLVLTPVPDPALSTGISQYANNTATVDNLTGSIQSLGAMSPGASASIAATGAVASIGFSANNANLNAYGAPAIIQGIGQVASNGIGAITNTGSITAGNLSTGASVSVGATGAVASLNVSAIDGGMAGLNIGPASDSVSPAAYLYYQNGGRDVVTIAALNNLAIYQSATNHGAITNTGTVTTGDLGLGASASVSATGAATSVAFSAINSVANGSIVLPISSSPTAASILQTSTNSGAVSNQILSGMTVGSLGNGASASISASGAVASLSVGLNTSTINVADGSTAFQFGGNTQTATNNETGSVFNAVPGVPATPNIMTVGPISGTGASASISASGAVASVSFSSILGVSTDVSHPAPVESYSTYRWDQSFGAIDQTATNNAPITNNGAITIAGVGGITGVSASASVGATGAATAFSVSSIADPVLTGPSGSALTSAIPASIYQVASNTGAITNTGSIAFTGAGSAVVLGVGASVSVSATGAVSSVSYRAVNNGGARSGGAT